MSNLNITIENVKSGDAWAIGDMRLEYGKVAFVVKGVKWIRKSDAVDFVAMPSSARVRKGEVVEDKTGQIIYDNHLFIDTDKETYVKFQESLKLKFREAIDAEALPPPADKTDDDVPF